MKQQLQTRFCDDAVRMMRDKKNHPDSYCWPLADLIEQSQKFYLDSAFCQAACKLVQQHPKQILKTVELCRAPYPLMWIECRVADRDFSVNADDPCITIEGEDVRLNKKTFESARCGWLLRELAPGCFELHAIQEKIACADEGVEVGIAIPLLHIFFVNEGIAINRYADIIKTIAPHDANARAMIDTEFRTRAINEQYKERTHDRFEGKDAETINMVYSMSTTMISRYLTNDLVKGMMDYGYDLYKLMDWSATMLEGDDFFMRAVLALMNSKTHVNVNRVDCEDVNRRRRKKGKSTFFSHNTVKFQPTIKQYEAMKQSGMSEAEISAHLVRGHFKLRKSKEGGHKYFWWNPFVRGNAVAGVVTKDYQFEEAADDEE